LATTKATTHARNQQTIGAKKKEAMKGIRRRMKKQQRNEELSLYSREY